MYSFARLPAPLPRVAIRHCHRRLLCSAQPLNHITAPSILESKRTYVVLSDLHVKRETVSVCVQALKIAHAEALKRDAAVLFLGDFWHARGALPVEPLNLVLKELQTWSVPVVMIPGNHDLISRTGNGVSLVPLATTLGATKCLLITKPSVCLDALFLPYMHETSKLKAALGQARHCLQDINAIFCHVEVAGARLADKIVSKPSSRSVSPTDFPAKVPVYSGHLHRPHTVSDNIRYVGSPYQVSAAEQGQQKALLVLDRKAGWAVVDTIPIDVGPRHITIPAQEFDSLPDIRPGDRVTVQTYSQEDGKMKHLVEQLRERGTRVEIQLVADGNNSNARQSIGDADPFAPAEPRISPGALSNIDLFQEYTTIKNLEPKITRAGKELLQEVTGKTSTLHTSISGKDVVIEWESVALRGFGSFLKPISYPLQKRGIVLVTGRDCDEDGAVSGRTNGTGKTTLVMSALWAMTGRTDARPDGSVERGVSLEMIHDDVDECEVTVNVNVRGDRVFSEAREMMSFEERQLAKLVPSNGAPVAESLQMAVTRTISRPRTSSKTRSYRQGLNLKVNGVDLTCLDVRETQSRIDRFINGTLLPHTVFFGQHMGPGRGLVDSTDRTLKEHLALVFPLDIWKDARRTAREKVNKLQDLILTSEATMEAAKTVVARLSVTETSAREQCASFEIAREGKAADVESRINNLLASKSRWDEDSVAYTESFATGVDQLTVTIDDCKQKLRRLEDNTESSLDNARATAAAALARATAALESADQLRTRVNSLVQKSEDWEAEHGKRRADIDEYLKTAEKELETMEGPVALDEKWKTASMEMRKCDERFQELVKLNIGQRYEAPTAQFSSQLSVVHDARERASALQEDCVRLQTSLNELRERLLQSQDVSLVSHDAPGEDRVSSSLSLAACESCLRPFDGELYVQARSQLEKEAAVIEDAIRLSEKKHEDENLQYERAVQALSDHIDKERVHILDKKSVISGAFSKLRSKRNARNALSREIEEFKTRAEVLKREPNFYMNELIEIIPIAWDSNGTGSCDKQDIMRSVEENLATSRDDLSRAKEDYEFVMIEVRARELDRADLILRRSALRTHLDDLIDLQTGCQSLENEKQSVLSETNPYMESLRRISNELATESSKVEKREREFSNLKDSVNTLKTLDVAFGPRGVPSFVLEEGLLWLEKLTRMYLHKLSAGELMLQIRAFSDYKSSSRVEGDNKEVISKKVFVRKSGSSPGVRERTLRQLSGGQRRRCSLAFALAFADLAHERAGFQSSLIVMDEILQALDEDGRQRISKILPSLIDEDHATRDTVLVVAQDEAPEIAGLAHGGIDVVVRNLDESSVLLDGKDPGPPDQALEL